MLNPMMERHQPGYFFCCLFVGRWDTMRQIQVGRNGFSCDAINQSASREGHDAIRAYNRTSAVQSAYRRQESGCRREPDGPWVRKCHLKNKLTARKRRRIRMQKALEGSGALQAGLNSDSGNRNAG